MGHHEFPLSCLALRRRRQPSLGVTRSSAEQLYSRGRGKDHIWRRARADGTHRHRRWGARALIERLRQPSSPSEETCVTRMPRISARTRSLNPNHSAIIRLPHRPLALRRESIRPEFAALGFFRFCALCVINRHPRRRVQGMGATHQTPRCRAACAIDCTPCKPLSPKFRSEQRRAARPRVALSDARKGYRRST